MITNSPSKVSSNHLWTIKVSEGFTCSRGCENGVRKHNKVAVLIPYHAVIWSILSILWDRCGITCIQFLLSSILYVLFMSSHLGVWQCRWERKLCNAMENLMLLFGKYREWLGINGIDARNLGHSTGIFDIPLMKGLIEQHVFLIRLRRSRVSDAWSMSRSIKL